MINFFRRRTRIAVNRAIKKKNPFIIYTAQNNDPAHRWVHKRKARERRFRRTGFAAIFLASLFLASLIWNIAASGRSAFTEAQVRLPVTFDAKLVEDGDYRKMIQNSLMELFPGVEDSQEKRALFGLVSRNAPYTLKRIAESYPELVGTRRDIWVPAASTVSVFYKQHMYQQSIRGGKVTKEHAAWVTELARAKKMRLKFNMAFLNNGDSREAELAGVRTAVIGSFMTILVCIAFSFPLGVATAIYLEEFAPKNWIKDFIEININNLAAVPSIIFGLLGLSIYLNLFGLPRSSPLVGGLTLALLILPTIVIATRNALEAVPRSIRYAAAALGATPTQVVFHHTLIYALPGIMTGVILGVARAFGETAPLLMIGMVAFVADIPKKFTDPATTLPVQVYLWASNPELGFVEKTAAAIMVLLAFMVLINLLAIFIRRRFEIKW